MQDIFVQIQNALWNVFFRAGFVDFIDMFFVALIIYQLFLLIRETRASSLLKGVFILLFACFFSSILGLTSLNWLLLALVNNGAIVLLILFQPEIRKMLEQLGRGSIKSLSKSIDLKRKDSDVEAITTALINLSKRRVGALIVFERRVGTKEIIDTGTKMDSEISSQLIENIFEPNTPLHDGAVIIRSNRIMAAGCILTLTQNKSVSRELGTRHRAALGVTETTDAITLIVSEETGVISMAREGKLTRHLDENALRSILSSIYKHNNDSLISTVFQKLISRGGSK